MLSVTRQSRNAVDIVVVGGGPAGASTALTAASAGAEVLVVERSMYEAVRVGETFPPVIQTALASLGLWERFSSSNHLPSNGIRSIWGSEAAVDRSFLFDPYGVGWQVDRRDFDESLATAAEERGVHFVRKGQLLDCQRDLPHQAWKLRIAAPGRTLEINARCLVDATGRACVLARRLGATRMIHDHFVGIYGFFRCAQGRGGEGFALIEAVEDGWWYSALLPGARLTVAFMTDTDICASAHLWEASRWEARLMAAPQTAARAAGLSLEGGLRVVPANSSLVEPACGPGWLAVGDAAMAMDPLAGQGVYNALQAGIAGGRVIREKDVWGEAFVSSYAAGVCERFDKYLKARAGYYSREQRWAESRFWRRRSITRMVGAGLVLSHSEIDG
jgi:flavin-dependent dehydrogenase